MVSMLYCFVSFKNDCIINTILGDSEVVMAPLDL